jgi:hypothetical protein
MRIGTGEVEGPEHSRQVLSFDKAVHGPSNGKGWINDIDGRAAHLEVDAARCGEDCISQRFKVEATPILPPEQPILRVFLAKLGIVRAGLLVGVREQNHSMESLGGPAFLDKLRCQIIQ